MARSESVNYGLFKARDTDEMSRLLGDVFAHRDPPAVAVGLTAPEFEVFVRLLCAKAEVEGLTLVARAAATDRIVGALLAEDSASTPPDGLNQVSVKFNPIFDILGQLDTEYRAGHNVPQGESIHLVLLGVAASFAGQGVAQQLVTRCVENSIRKGYRHAVTEATNKTSQHVFRKLGFVERVQRSYEDHRFEGRAFFTRSAAPG